MCLGTEDRCLINGCQKEIACSVCGGCEEHHRIKLENGECKIHEMTNEINDTYQKDENALVQLVENMFEHYNIDLSDIMSILKDRVEVANDE